MNLHLGKSLGDIFRDADFYEISTFDKINSGYFSSGRISPFLSDEEFSAIATLENTQGNFIPRSSTGVLTNEFEALTFVLGGLTGVEMR